LAESQFSIGTLKKNPKEAAKWFLLAAEQGLAEAQFSIGAMYDFGEGVSQNFVEAEKWYFAAMKQGFIAAAVNLGELARDGKGVIQDYKKAFTMFKLSADYKSAVAHFNLGNAYSKAEGVPKDNVMAIMHYTIASELSEFRIPEAVEEIKALELTLSSDQIIEAQGLAKEWLKKFSKVKTPDSAKFWGYSLDRETFDPIASD
jgi:hypothetical protein